MWFADGASRDQSQSSSVHAGASGRESWPRGNIRNLPPCRLSVGSYGTYVRPWGRSKPGSGALRGKSSNPSRSSFPILCVRQRPATLQPLLLAGRLRTLGDEWASPADGHGGKSQLVPSSLAASSTTTRLHVALRTTRYTPLHCYSS